MNELQAALKIALANTFVMYFKSHVYHWNVEGPNFAQYHEFFNDLYTELYEAVDPLAEHIRAIDGYAPVGLADLYDAKIVADDQSLVTSTSQMFLNLLDANNATIDSLNKAFDMATYAKKQGLCNFLADRLDIHAKHGWQLKALIKG
jgi:starvation-inducible DNA-binding protein